MDGGFEIEKEHIWELPNEGWVGECIYCDGGRWGRVRDKHCTAHTNFHMWWAML